MLCALEWVTNHKGFFSVTQLAALRTNAAWEKEDVFDLRIEPLGPSFHLWDNPAFNGYSPYEFLNAQNGYTVFQRFARWLRAEDVLCWWDQLSLQYFKKAYEMLFKHTPGYRMLALNQYFGSCLADGKCIRGSAYKICAHREIAIEGTEHCAIHDVHAMRTFLESVAFPQQALESPPQKKPPKQPSAPGRTFNYLYDPEQNLLHKPDCPYLPQGVPRSGYDSLEKCMERGFRLCSSCLSREVEKWRRERNGKHLQKLRNQYVYAQGSGVFHRRACKLILPAKEICSSRYFYSCYDRGMRPCRICKPLPIARNTGQADDQIETEKSKKKVTLIVGNRLLSSGEEKAYKRFVQAKRERISYRALQEMDGQRRADHLTLTHPGYVFFAGSGYKTFHRSSCGILGKLSHICGFATYEKAAASGRRPCRKCKPDARDDVELSIPITNEEKENETAEMLEALCREAGLACRVEEPYFFLETPVGKWRIHLHARPVIVHHINLAKNPDNTTYHRQHRLFLSLKDTFDYIHRHDHVGRTADE